MIDTQLHAHIYVNGQLERRQRLAGKTNTQKECKRVLKSIFSELKPLASKYPENTYYVELRRIEKM